MSLASMVLEELEQKERDLKLYKATVESEVRYQKAMLEELKYFKEAFKEQAAIIKQLVDGPGEVEYIHPYDFAEMIDSMSVSECIDIWKRGDTVSACLSSDEFLSGKRYKVSTLTPARTTKFV